jgi:uncharacterized membrane protein YvbJ
MYCEHIFLVNFQTCGVIEEASKLMCKKCGTKIGDKESQCYCGKYVFSGLRITKATVRKSRNSVEIDENSDNP